MTRYPFKMHDGQDDDAQGERWLKMGGCKIDHLTPDLRKQAVILRADMNETQNEMAASLHGGNEAAR